MPFTILNLLIKLPGMKRIILLSDLHCGHETGLTAPEFQRGRFEEIQAKTWEWYSQKMAEIGPVDFAVMVGDAIDGDGRINSGVELLSTDRMDQADMAERALEEIQTNRFGFIIGSPYHVGKSESFERILAERIGAEFCEIHHQLSVLGTIFDLKHVVGGTSIPHGKTGSLEKEGLWATLKAERGLAEKPHVIARAHTHHFAYSGDVHGLRIKLPALQVHSHYGLKNFSSITDYGFVLFEVHGPGEYTWKPYILELNFTKKGAHAV